MRRVLASFAAASVLLAPAWALACPVCAQREDGGPLGTVALGAFIVAPWFIAFGIGWWIRRGLLTEAAQTGSEINE